MMFTHNDPTATVVINATKQNVTEHRLTECPCFIRGCGKACSLGRLMDM